MTEAIKSRHCRHCNQDKDMSAFYQTGRQSYSWWCKECHREWSRQHKANGYKNPYTPKPDGRRRLTDIEYAAYVLWTNAQKKHTRDGKPFSLTREQVESLVKEFCQNNYYEAPRNGKSPFQPSLDRIDTNKGYEMGNIRVVWLVENYARNSFSDEQVIEFCKRKLGLL